MTQRRARAGGVALLLAVGLTACGEENTPFQGEDFISATSGANEQVGEVLLRDVSIDEPPDTEFEPGDAVRLHLTLVNQAEVPDALLAVSTSVADAAAVLVDSDCDGTFETAGEVPLPATPVVRTPSTDRPDGPTVDYLVGLRLDERVASGSSVPITFVFRNAGTATFEIPVELSDAPLREDDGACEPSA